MVGVYLDVRQPAVGDVAFCEDGFDRTGRNARAAVNADLRIDVEHLVGRLAVNAVHGTDVDAAAVLGTDAGFRDDVGHVLTITPEGGPDSDRSCSLAATKGAMLHNDLYFDVRQIPVPERHPRIFELLETLHAGQSLVLTTDHEPRPLRLEVEHRFARRFIWAQHRHGDGRWQARIRQVGGDEASSVAATLRSCAAFAEAGDMALNDLAHFTRRTTIKRRHCVADQGIAWPYVAIVDRGLVHAQVVTSSGRAHVAYDVSPGELFGEFALFDGGSVTLRYVAATEDTIVLLVPVERVRALIDRERIVARRIEESCAQHARAVIERFSAQVTLSSTARVATALLPFASPGRGLTPALGHLTTMTQAELASSAGTIKEVVSRALAELELRGAVRRQHGHIALLDRAELLAAIGQDGVQ